MNDLIKFNDIRLTIIKKEHIHGAVLGEDFFSFDIISYGNLITLKYNIYVDDAKDIYKKDREKLIDILDSKGVK